MPNLPKTVGVAHHLFCSPSQLVFKSATELLHLLQTRSISSVELVQAYLDHIALYNPSINAVITLDAESALAQAKAADDALTRGDSWGPLHGMPMTVKDALATAGLRTTFGAPETDNYVPKIDAALVRTVKQAGAIILGKSSLSRKAYDWQCQHPTAGRANNPWHLNHTPGGSSGGAAAALAAGFTPLELGSDLAGSIRLPAHFCGVCGLRPTEGRLCHRGHMAIPGVPDTLRSFIVVGPLARNIPDLKLLWSVLCQHHSIQHSGMVSSIISQGSLMGGLTGDSTINLQGVKLAWTSQLGNIPVDAETQKTLLTFRQTLEQAGCQVETVEIETLLPGQTWEDLLDLAGLIHGSEVIPLLPTAIRKTPLRYLLPQLYWPYRLGNSRLAKAIARGNCLGVDGYLRALEKRDRIIHQMDEFLTQWDGWLCPVVPTPAMTHRKPATPIDVNGQTYPYADVFGMYLSTTALLATPAVTFPVGMASTGLPIGIQLHGHRWQDDRILNLAEKIQSLIEPLPTVPNSLAHSTVID